MQIAQGYITRCVTSSVPSLVRQWWDLYYRHCQHHQLTGIFLLSNFWSTKVNVCEGGDGGDGDDDDDVMV